MKINRGTDENVVRGYRKFVPCSTQFVDVEFCFSYMTWKSKGCKMAQIAPFKNRKGLLKLWGLNHKFMEVL